jgi:hypothetical protein
MSIFNSGWGRGSWGEGAWNSRLPDVTGVEATGAIGTPLIREGCTAFPTGVSVTGAVGSVVVSGDASILVTGVAATGIAGILNIWGEIDTAQNPNWQEIAA